MTLRALGAVAGLTAAALALAWGASRLRLRPDPIEPAPLEATFELRAPTGSPEALARLGEIRGYDDMLRRGAVRSARLAANGSVQFTLELRAWARARLAPFHREPWAELVPARVHVAIAPAGGKRWKETWRFDPEDSGMLDLLDPRLAGAVSSSLSAGVPAAPVSIARIRVDAAQLARPDLGGGALRPLRERLDLAESVLGRPFRREMAEDLEGSALFALYDDAGNGRPDGVALFALKRSDRVRALAETAFALASLTEAGSVHRYRDVMTGSWAPRGGGRGLAVAVDGDVLLAATSRSRLEAAIDRRRSSEHGLAEPAEPSEDRTAWAAHSASAFVGRGWDRILGSAELGAPPVSESHAVISREGDRWVLRGDGPRPALAADPVIPFLRSLFAPSRQRAGG